jgi:hypothetical protein
VTAAATLRWPVRAGGLVAAMATAALVLGGATPAAALPILDNADATELAQALAEATEDQDVCYGWKVTVYDYGGSSDGVDEGSSLGVGQSANQVECPRWVVFEATLVYTDAASEAEDSATFSVRSNVPEGPSSTDLREAGISEAGLLGGNDDQVVADATLLLPALMAEQGLADPISLEPNTQTLPAGDRATGTPGSDWLRKYGAALTVAALLVGGGLGWAAWILLRERPFAAAPVRTMSRRKGNGGLRQ